MKKKILISTGGTGGHVIPANIFYEHLKNNFDVFLTTDERGKNYLSLDSEKIHIINTPKLKNNFLFLPYIFLKLIYLIIKSFLFIKKNKISTLISTGGYMSLPLCIASKILNLEIYLFEPNMVIGRANIFFLKFCKKIFCYSNKIINYPKKYLHKIVVINPLLRKNFYSIKLNTSQIDKEIKLLIIGGSQGAKFFDNDIKDAVIGLSGKYKLKVYQQTNSENIERLKIFYNSKNINCKLFDFNQNVLEFILDSNLCITRAGASTLSELTSLNIPYLAIPYPFAKDNHQYENALFYKNKNCCWLLDQNSVTSNLLLRKLIEIVENKDDYLEKKKNMKNFSYQNDWNKINEKIIQTINEN